MSKNSNNGIELTAVDSFKTAEYPVFTHSDIINLQIERRKRQTENQKRWENFQEKFPIENNKPSEQAKIHAQRGCWEAACAKDLERRIDRALEINAAVRANKITIKEAKKLDDDEHISWTTGIDRRIQKIADQYYKEWLQHNVGMTSED